MSPAFLFITVLAASIGSGASDTCAPLFAEYAASKVKIAHAQSPEQRGALDFTAFYVTFGSDGGGGHEASSVLTECARTNAKPIKLILKYREKGSTSWNRTVIRPETTEVQLGSGIKPCSTYQFLLTVRQGPISHLRLGDHETGPRPVSDIRLRLDPVSIPLSPEDLMMMAEWDGDACPEFWRVIVEGDGDRTENLLPSSTTHWRVRLHPCTDTAVSVTPVVNGRDGLTKKRVFYELPNSFPIAAKVDSSEKAITWDTKELSAACKKVYSSRFDAYVRKLGDEDEGATVLVDSQTIDFFDMGVGHRLDADAIEEEMRMKGLLGPCQRYALDLNVTVMGEGGKEAVQGLLTDVDVTSDSDGKVHLASELTENCVAENKRRQGKAIAQPVVTLEEENDGDLDSGLDLVEKILTPKEMGGDGDASESTTTTTTTTTTSTHTECSTEPGTEATTTTTEHYDEYDAIADPAAPPTREGRAKLSLAVIDPLNVGSPETSGTEAGSTASIAMIVGIVIAVIVVIAIAIFFGVATRRRWSERSSRDGADVPEWEKRAAKEPLTLRSSADGNGAITELNTIVANNDGGGNDSKA